MLVVPLIMFSKFGWTYGYSLSIFGIFILCSCNAFVCFLGIYRELCIFLVFFRWIECSLIHMLTYFECRVGISFSWFAHLILYFGNCFWGEFKAHGSQLCFFFFFNLNMFKCFDLHSHMQSVLITCLFDFLFLPLHILVICEIGDNCLLIVLRDRNWSFICCDCEVVPYC